jgi:hypothetical protein
LSASGLGPLASPATGALPFVIGLLIPNSSTTQTGA